MKDFVSFGTGCQSMIYMSNRFLKDNINGVRVPKFQLAYISKKTNPLYFKNGEFVSWCVLYVGGGKQYLEHQEWKDCTKSKIQGY